MGGKPAEYSTWLVVVLALAFPFVMGLVRIHDGDFFWQLKAGEWIWSHAAVPHVEQFSSSIAGQPWIDWEWLFQAAIYLVYDLGGFTGLVVAKAGVVACTGAVIFASGRRGGAGPLLAALVVIVTFIPTQSRLDVKPDVVAFLIAASAMWLLESARRGETRWLFGLPLLQMLWVNVHPSFLLGICLLGAYALAPAAAAVASRRVQPALPYAASGLLVLGACLVNPYGSELFSHAIEEVSGVGASLEVLEFRPAWGLLLTEPNWSLRVFWGSLWLIPSLLLARLVLGGRGAFPWAHFVVWIGLGALALRSYRFAALYAIVTGPILCSGLHWAGGWIEGARQRRGGARRVLATPGARRWAGVVFVGALGGFCIGVTATDRWAMAENRPRDFGVGVDEQTVPVRALSVIASLPAENRDDLFNTYTLGGSVIWKLHPQRRAFVDARANLYGPAFLHRYAAAMRNPEDWEAWMTERGVRVSLVGYVTDEDLILLRHLEQSDEWILLYFDHVAGIFIRRDAFPSSVWISADQWRDPEDVRRHVRGLADEVAGADPYVRGRVFSDAGSLLLAMGRDESARLLLEEALVWNPRTAVAWTNLATIHFNRGEPERAAELASELLRRNPRAYKARFLRAHVELARGDLEAALRDVDRVLTQVPDSRDALTLRAQLALRQQDHPRAIAVLQSLAAQQIDDVEVYLTLARLLIQEGRLAEAEAAYQEGARLPGAEHRMRSLRARLDRREELDRRSE